MTTLNWKSTVMWTALSLLFLLLALMVGPAPALAGGIGRGVGAVLYEVTEDMYLLDEQGNPTLPQYAAKRSAVAQLSGTAKLGTALCPWEVLHLTPGAKQCTVNATGADELWLGGPEAGKGKVSGTFAVVVQGDNSTDAPEFVVMTGAFAGAADLSLAFGNTAPLGFITDGKGYIDKDGNGSADVAFTFTGTFRLPFALNAAGQKDKPKRHRNAWYLADDFKTKLPVEANEKSLGFPTVRLEIRFQ